jgi:hypothetical protein
MIIVLLLFICFILFFNIILEKQNFSNETFENNKSIDIVIARYNEDLKWTLDEPFNQFSYIVYNKGNNDNFEKSKVKKIINIDNIGKCDHTYLYHITTNYNNLADITVFLPGSTNMDYKKNIATKILNNILKYNQAIFCGNTTNNVKDFFYNFTLDEWATSYSNNLNSNISNKLDKSSIRPYGKWFETRFGNIQPQHYCFMGIFSIDKNDIKQHPIDRYQQLVEELNYPNPEVGHYIERSWGAIFYPLTYTKFIN